VKFVSRSEWGAEYAQGSGAIPGPVYGVTCHWEGPHMGDFAHSVCTRKVRTIERFHAVTRGWSGIAYSAVVCPHGYVFEGRGIGVRTAANGESAIGGNDHWYAVCYLGGAGDPFTAAGQRGMADAIAWLRRGGAGPKVNGHRDHHATECPGDDIYAWAHSAAPNRTAPEEDDMADPETVEAVARRTVELMLADDHAPRRKMIAGSNLTAGQILDQIHNRTGDTRERLARANDLLRTLRGQSAKLRHAVDHLPEGATKAEVRGLLESLDATINLIVRETEESA
jgi:hypothetical protein